jgi:hypothetical protein
MPVPDDLTVDVLRHLYQDDLLTETEIAKAYGVSQAKVGRLRKHWGIPTLLKSDRLRLPLEFTDQQRSLLIGSMLGDGRLFKTGVETAAYSEYHALKQRPYLDWKVSLWGSFVTRVADGVHPLGYEGASFATHASKLFRPFWELFYPSGRGDKVFSSLDPTFVDSFALAVWFMDDGSRTNNYARLSVGPDERSQRVQLRILRQFGLTPTIYSYAGDTSILIDGRTNYSKFVDLVSPHLIPSMSYKLEVTPRRSGAAPRDVLTQERLEEFHRRGLTLQDIAQVTGTSRTSVSRISRGFGFKEKTPGRPKVGSSPLYSVVVSTSLLEALGGQPNVDVVCGILSRTELPVRVLSPEAAQHDLSLLRKAPTKVVGGTLTGVTKGGSQFCAQFFPHILDAKYRNYPSPKEAWYLEDWVRRAVRFQLRVGDPVTPIRVFRAVRAVVRAPTNFRPCFAKALVEAYCPEDGTVLDPCAGYGGRACGTLAAGRSYVGVDPHPKAEEAFTHLREALHGPLEFLPGAFEDVNLGSLQADMVLTSPPYFSVERYSNDPSQSWVRYKTWTSWVYGFLAPFVERSWQHLKPGGTFCVNTKDIRVGRQTLAIGAEFVRLAGLRGFELVQVLALPLGRIGKVARSEPVYVFRKPV